MCIEINNNDDKKKNKKNTGFRNKIRKKEKKRKKKNNISEKRGVFIFSRKMAGLKAMLSTLVVMAIEADYR